MSKTVPGVDRNQSIVLTQYNVLAESYGSNLRPWFLHGVNPPLTKAQRVSLLEAYLLKDESGHYVNDSFTKWARGVLTEHQIAQAERHHDENFAWEARKARLIDRILENSPDIVTLSEVDNYEYFKRELADKGNLDCAWIQRPLGHADGSCIGWDKSRFSVVAQDNSTFKERKEDGGSEFDSRAALFVVLKEKATGRHLVVVSTHLAKLPDDVSYEWFRAREMLQLGVALFEFVSQNRVPPTSAVILAGDLNCLDMKRLTSMGQVATWLCGTKAHEILYNPMIIETKATSVTQARISRIDYVVYTKSHLKLEMHYPLPKGMTPIPNSKEPSDHYPVSVVFQYWQDAAFKESCALAYVSTLIPEKGKSSDGSFLTAKEVEAAFRWFLEFEGGETLNIHGFGFGDGIMKLKSKLKLKSLSAVRLTFQNFIVQFDLQKRGQYILDLQRFKKLYYEVLLLDSVPDMLLFEEVFQFFNSSSSAEHELSPEKLKSVIKKMTGSEVDAVRFEDVWNEIDTNGDGIISKQEFTAWIRRTFKAHYLNY